MQKLNIVFNMVRLKGATSTDERAREIKIVFYLRSITITITNKRLLSNKRNLSSWQFTTLKDKLSTSQ